jgi:phosphate/phosphite/phosphonate ABC transporter binding protein
LTHILFSIYNAASVFQFFYIFLENGMIKQKISTVSLLFIFLSLLFYHEGRANSTSINIGVLAKRGEAQAMEQWAPTADYLNWMLPEYHFEIIPLDFDAIYPAVQNQEVDFILTNSAFYVGLVYHYNVERILTLKNRRLNQGTKQFGGVIFTRKENNSIKTIEDLRGTKFMAVDKNSFGGWLMARYHIKQHGILPEKHFQSINFGGTHDAVVYAVEKGEADAGTVRTDTLEHMHMEGKINIDSFKILDRQDSDENFPFMLSTELYPEWPLAVLPHVDETITTRVLIALLQLSPEQEAAIAGGITGWVNALDYHSVRNCLQSLRVYPFENYNVITWQESMRQHWKLYMVLCLIILVVLFATGSLMILNRRLKSTMGKLDSELINNTRLSDNLQQFKLTLDQTLDCVFMFDPITLRYIYANQGAVDQVGYSLEELHDMTPLDLKPDLNERQFRTLLSPLTQEQKKSIIYTTRHISKSGDTIPVEIVQQYVELSEGENRFISIVRDITERLHEDQEKEKLHSQLLHAQKLESVGQLAAGIAHEINTPTQFIGTNIDFLGDACEDLTALMHAIQEINKDAPAEMQKRIKAALESADWEFLEEELPLAITQSQDGVQRVTTIVRAMKEFSHPGSKEKMPQDLNKIINTTITVARNEWKYVADMETDLAPDLPQVPLLADEMGQVILNMLVNGAHAIAQKHGKNPAGEKGKIRIMTRQRTNTVELRIQDSGSGIPKKAQPRIFDPFYTTKEVGKGTGQGLAISHDVIVEKHGGNITFTTETDIGTEFIITLPLAEDTAYA